MKTDNTLLSNIRMAATTLSEPYYAMKNFLDHVAGGAERLQAPEKYLRGRIKAYKGQKRAAFLYHGYLQARPAFARIAHLLEGDLFNTFTICGGYQPFNLDLRISSDWERKIIEKVLAETDIEEVFLIGHSQGGLVARAIVQMEPPNAKITRVSTLGSPHQGTYAAYAGFFVDPIIRMFERGMKLKFGTDSARQMLPGSDFLQHINSLPLPQNILFSSIYSQIDPLVWPPAYCRIPYHEALNIHMKRVGHMQVLYDLQAVELLLRTLYLPVDQLRNPRESLLRGYTAFERHTDRPGRGEIDEWVAASD